MSALVSVLIPAHNEADYIGACLEALFASAPLPNTARVEVLVLANGCDDETASIARSIPVPKDWTCTVLELPEGGKLAALNLGDAAANGSVLVYLDADVIVSKPLLGQLVLALAQERPLYASGTPRISSARTAVTRAYGRFWAKLPFVTQGVPGFGLFAMNRAGRKRWQHWPDIISDDTFARLSFQPSERIPVPGSYSWPMVEGFANLVRVRRRQNAGVTEIGRLFPHLLMNDDKRPLEGRDLLQQVIRDPAGFTIYAAVSLAVKTPLFRTKTRWTRGR